MTDHIFIEIELTQVDDKGEICSLAAVRTDGNGNMLRGMESEVATAVKHEENGSGAVLIQPPTFEVVWKRFHESLIAPFEESYVVVGFSTEAKRAFLKRAANADSVPRDMLPESVNLVNAVLTRPWIDLVQLAWPFLMSGRISSRSLEELARHFKQTNPSPDTAIGDCETILKVYWSMVKSYYVGLVADENIREIGGEALNSVRKWFGLSP